MVLYNPILSAASGEEFTIGYQGCLQSYHIQMHRLSEEGQIIHDDFCMSLTEPKSGSVVSPTGTSMLYMHYLGTLSHV